MEKTRGVALYGISLAPPVSWSTYDKRVSLLTKGTGESCCLLPEYPGLPPAAISHSNLGTHLRSSYMAMDARAPLTGVTRGADGV